MHFEREPGTPARQQELGPAGEHSSGVIKASRGAGPLVIEVLAPNLTGSGLPRTGAGERGQAFAGPRDVGGEEAYRLLSFLDRLRLEFDRRITVHLVEPLSLAWMMRVIRHRPRRYPAFLVGRRTVVVGLDEAAVRGAIAEVLRGSYPGERGAGVGANAGRKPHSRHEDSPR
ncbi:MAG: hypothetical protein A2Z07_04110 [Armatimonadetes bacterium RBG_16_67_12]|nr:MAG: hypothetical protein A2Z07_04110 [Armatimonadetes bacterium RBG_16_67_12]